MKFELYQRVILVRDVPEENLKQGDVAWLIDYLPHPEGGEGVVLLGVINLGGDPVDFLSVPASAIVLWRADPILAVRQLEIR